MSPPLPRLPIFGWHTFTGPKASPLPAVTSHADVTFTTSGRAAILAALNALGLGPGDKVLVPTYHCPTMIAPAVVVGATPVFYPITARGAADLAWLSRQSLAGVRALLAAHFFGVPQPMRALRRFCDTHGIALIEDCAHAFFGVSDGRVVGGWGDFAIASLTKFFPVNEGGLLISQPPHPAPTLARTASWQEEMRSLIDALELGAHHARFAGANVLLNGAFSLKRTLKRPLRHTAPAPDATALPIDPQLLRPLRQCTRVAQWIFRRTHQARIIERRRHHYSQLVAMLSDTPGLTALTPRLPDGAAPYVMPLLVRTGDPAYHALRAAQIPVFRWCQPWPGTPDLPGDAAPRWARELFQLGCHQDLSERAIAHIADTVKRLCA